MREKTSHHSIKTKHLTKPSFLAPCPLCFLPALDLTFEKKNKLYFAFLRAYPLLLCALCILKHKNFHDSIPSAFVMYSHRLCGSLVLEAGYGQEIIAQDSNWKNADLLSGGK